MIEYVPGGVAPEVEIVRVDDPDPPEMTLPGEKLAVAPAGTPLTLKVTFPVKPLKGEMVTVYCAAPPAVTDCVVGAIEPTKSPVEVFTNRGIVVLFPSLPLTPAMVRV